MQASESFTIVVDETHSVSALLRVPPQASALFVFAHGAGAGMHHPTIAAFADGLAERRIATLRYQFPGMERGSRRPDPAPLAEATVRAAVVQATASCPSVPLFAGGKSFGGRMTSQAQAASPLPQVRGLIFIGFPLHPADKPSNTRAAHLSSVGCPMLFLQGSRDALADIALLGPVVAALGARATLRLFPDADHAFHVRRSSGTDDEAVRAAMLDAAADWMTS